VLAAAGKLLESALVKLSSVASKLTTVSAQDMIKAMIGGRRDPHELAALARGRMRAKHDDLVEAVARSILVIIWVRREALSLRMEVKDRPSPRRRSGGVKREAA